MNADEINQEEKLAETAAAASGIPYLDTRELDWSSIYNCPISLDQLREYRVAPLHTYSGTSLELGVTDQTDRTALPKLQSEFADIKLTFKTISHIGYNTILGHIYYHMFQAERDGDFNMFGEKLATASPKQAFQFIAQLAYWLGASDIHIEPQSEAARIRFRIDGVLHLITSVATDSYEIFLSDLQTRAEIKWGSDTPQSGRISFNLMGNDTKILAVNMRIETIPTFHGEEIVVRIFNSETRNLKLETMGFNQTQLDRLSAVAAHPNGLMLTVGPTGSGKTSTLYALINRLNKPDVKIITLEDPVEYDLPGITQIPVMTEDKDSFANKLRAVMREDPNVVMIGEIRDVDTAKTALQAALTGHLVLSTFHATNTSAAIMRMMDMIGPNPLFASAVRTIVAQRLARRICPHCIQEIAATDSETAFITEAMARIPEGRRPVVSTKITLKRGTGCKECHGLGYLGRVAIIELMTITHDIEAMMVSSSGTTAQLIEEKAVRNGMITLLEDGIGKALAGTTTVEEVMSLLEL